jgi:hypothetical protein
MTVEGMHHSAYRCRDSVPTRAFDENSARHQARAKLDRWTAARHTQQVR